MVYKILWHSNAPWLGSGYGNQTALFTLCMANDPDFEPTVSALYGLQGRMLKANGVTVLPGSKVSHGSDILAARYDATDCDAMVGLYDVWVYPDNVLESRPFTWWTPVDHDPIPQIVAEKLHHVAYPWAMSKHGFDQMRDVGLTPRYVPHGVNTEHYYPIDRKEARKHFDYLDDETFFVVSVAANKGKDDRKNLRVMLHAFARFVQDHPNSKFYMHTLPTIHDDGINLERLVNQLGLDDKVVFPNVFKMVEGLYQYPQLNQLYNAADVFLLPSAGEGFGIPVIEAQAAGCPVIVNDFTAQGELVGAGFKIQIDSDDLEYTISGSYRARVRVSKVLTALKLAYEWKGDPLLRKTARDFIVKNYDYEHVWKTYMKPALIEQIEGRRGDAVRRETHTEERLKIRFDSQERDTIEDTKELIVSEMVSV